MEFPVLGITEPMSWAVIACVVMMCFDVLTGFMAAWKNKEIESTVMREGLFHKGTLILVIVLAWMCELFVMHVPDLGLSVPLVVPACVIIFAMELTSIMENMVKINPELKTSKIMQLLKITGDESGEDDA